MRKIFSPIFILLLSYVSALAQVELDSMPFATGLADPVVIVHAGDERLFVAEQRGLIRILDQQGNLADTAFLDLSGKVSQSGSETGLLGLVFHPDYEENGYFFVNYTRTSDGSTVVSRFSTHPENPDRADPDSEVQLLIVSQPYANHNGGQLLFGPDGYLYISMGDGGGSGDPQSRGQARNTLLGKILRIDVNVEEGETYAIPEDNPFVNDETTLDEIWAWGLRNPWRSSFDRLTGDFWIADVGHNGWEEINFHQAGNPGGGNYGWKCYEGNELYSQTDCPGAENFIFPVFQYPHQNSGCSGSVTGGYVYRGALYNDLFGAYIFADYCSGTGYIITRTQDGFEGKEISDFNEIGISTFGEDLYGELYLAKKSAGEIYKIKDTVDCEPVAKILAGDTTIVLERDSTISIEALYHPSLEYEWRKNDEPLDSANQHQLVVTEEGIYTVQVTNPENGCSSISDPLEVKMFPPLSSPMILKDIRIFPNPAKNILYIRGLPTTGKTSITLVDSRGSIVQSAILKSQSETQISTGELPEGMYFLKIINDNKLYREKIIVSGF